MLEILIMKAYLYQVITLLDFIHLLTLMMLRKKIEFTQFSDIPRPLQIIIKFMVT
jgi:hypothetical protein